MSSPSPPFTHYIFKLIFIGDSNTGKTSIINRFVHNSFNDSHVCTIGVDFMISNKLQWDKASNMGYSGNGKV
jgi:GTPase SAR1 family protein